MVTGHQQMNQAGSEKKCSKSVSYECVLNNYNYDDVSADQNSICENYKQRGWSASAYGKHSSNVGSVCNADHVVGVAEVCSDEAKSQQQPSASNIFEQSLLQKAWIYLQSVINTHMSACSRCNPRPPPDDESPSQSTTQFFQRSTPLGTSPSFISSCHRTRPTCSRTISPCQNARPRVCPRASPPCPNFESCSNAKSSKTSTYYKSNTNSLFDPPSPNTNLAYADAKSRLNSSQNSKTSIYHKDCHHSPFDSPSLSAKPPRLNAMPPRPNLKTSLNQSVSKDSVSDSSYSKLQSPCPNTKSACPKAKPVCSDSKLVCQNSKTSIYHKDCHHSPFDPPSPNANLAYPDVKSRLNSSQNSKTSIYHKDCHHSPFDPPSPNANLAYPDVKSRLNSSQNSKTSIYHKDCHHSPFDSPSPSAKPPRLNAMPPRPNLKTSLHQSVSKDSVSDSSYSNLKSPCPNTESAYPKAKPVSSDSKLVCPKSKLVCPNSKLVCPNSKTCLYHNFSNDSLPSSCKESLVEMAKVYLEKLTPNHKMKCPGCGKQCSYYSLKAITLYLRGVLEQAWNNINTGAEQISSQSQRSQSNCSNAFTNSGILKFARSTKSRCSCAASKPKFPKPLSCESEGHRRSIKCPTCLTRFICPKAARLNFAPGLNMHYVDDADECEEPKSPDRRSKEEGTHEHKSCCTHCCMHNSQSTQPSFNLSNTSFWSPQSYAEPVFIKSRQIKTPQSVEELKASVTGITDKQSGNFYGYDVLDLRSTIDHLYSRPCVQDSNVSKELICLTDDPTPKLVLDLTMEQKDVGSRPKESNHSRESLDNCKETISPCSDLEGQTCKEEALYPNQSCSEGSRKFDANHVDVIGEESGSMLRKQLSNKETISKTGHNSMTSIETIQSDRKGKVLSEYNSYEYFKN